MSRGIEISGGRATQVAALLFGAVAIGSGYLLISTGVGSPFIHCPHPIDPPLATVLGGLRIAIGVGLVGAAVRDPRGLTARDTLLVTLILALVALIAIGSSARAFVTGVVYLFRSGCLELGAPWSYILATLGLAVAIVALAGAAAVFLGAGGSGEDDD